jgi:hypothetical protein
MTGAYMDNDEPWREASGESEGKFLQTSIKQGKLI